jgi:hypothetical protein
MKEAVTAKAARIIASRIEDGGERLWQLRDFDDLPFTATAQTLSRLTRKGMIERLSKGIYYRPRMTSFGKSLSNPARLQELLPHRRRAFPAGIAAASLLGLTTQMPKRQEIATSSLSLPRKLLGKDAILHTRRPESWNKLSDIEIALLDVLRQGGKTSELSAEKTIEKLRALLSEEARFERLLKIADTEPPRARAILGAFGETMGKDRKQLEKLRRSLNPFSRFEFGLFTNLPDAYKWQAKGQ